MFETGTLPHHDIDRAKEEVNDQRPHPHSEMTRLVVGGLLHPPMHSARRALADPKVGQTRAAHLPIVPRSPPRHLTGSLSRLLLSGRRTSVLEKLDRAYRLALYRALVARPPMDLDCSIVEGGQALRDGLEHPCYCVDVNRRELIPVQRHLVRHLDCACWTFPVVTPQRYIEKNRGFNGAVQGVLAQP